jgi:GMP synthase (glutamine-hydrolysing)
MKALIIDNGTSYLRQLQELLRGHSVEVLPYWRLTEGVPLANCDVVILSGGHLFPVLGNEINLQNEISFVKMAAVPVFGICYGFQVIARAFGATLEKMERKEHGILEIAVSQQDPLFKGISSFKVFESHRWVIRESAPELMALARSVDGIEVIRHASRPIYGVQFHPEMFVDRTCGDEIFHNFLSLIGSVAAGEAFG